jgi:hypothetical protein
LLLSACSSQKEKCERNVEIFRGPAFEAGQKYKVLIDGREIMSERFLLSVSSGEYVKKEDYCCNSDSCRVEFILDDHDTLFYINPSRVTKFVVGSDLHGRPAVATSENHDAWIKM